MWLVLIERSFQGLSVAVENVGIVKKLVEIWPNKVCDSVPAFGNQGLNNESVLGGNRVLLE